MKKVTGDEEFIMPIILLLMFSLLFSFEITDYFKPDDVEHSVFQAVPVVFTGNFFETLGRLFYFSIPAILFFAAIKEPNLHLKVIYLIGTVPLVLTGQMIDKLGYMDLHVIKILFCFVTIMLVFRYLVRTTDLYKKAMKNKADNLTATQDGSKARRL